MCVIHLLQDGLKARKDGGRLVVEKEQKIISSTPILQIESLIICKFAQITTQAVFSLIENKIPLFYVDWKGRIVAALKNENQSVKNLLKQISVMQETSKQLQLAKYIVTKKLTAQKQLVSDYAKNKKKTDLKEIAQNLQLYLDSIEQADSVDRLRGMEGIAAKHYFDAFPFIINNNIWKWGGRRKHPSIDPVNALLSLSYSFLEREVRIALIGTGLDCRIGFLHSNNGRKDSLVFDVMELFRQKIGDSFVLSLLNRKKFSTADFTTTNEGCSLGKDAYIKWCQWFEEYVNKPAKKYNNKSPRKYVLSETRLLAAMILADSET